MKFKGHLLGGMIAGVVVVGIAIQSDVVTMAVSSPSELPQAILEGGNGVLPAFGLFLLTTLMALFPDLDTASIPQRWFFRTAYALLVILLLLKMMEIFAIATLILLLPLLHQHRGWTHSKLTPVVMGVVMILVLGYIRIPYLLDRLSLSLLRSLFEEFWIVLPACMLGHYTHLILDSR